MKEPKCDRCKVTVGNYQYEPGKWRCPRCVWKERERLSAACEAVLLFYSPPPWSQDKRRRWRELAGTLEATTKVLRNFVLAVVKETG